MAKIGLDAGHYPDDTITVSALNQAGSGKRLTFDWRYAVIGT